jgi:hypothetical protein
MTKLIPAAITVLALLLAGCATTDTASASSDDCFNIRQVNSWSAIDRDHVYLEERGDDNYLLTLFSSCPGLKFTQVIALSNHMGRMCPNDFGRITFRDAGNVRSCRIDDVERVADKAAAIALVEARNKDADD